MRTKYYLLDDPDNPEVLPFFATLGLAIGLGWLGGVFLPMYSMLDVFPLAILWFGLLGGLAVSWAIVTGIFDQKSSLDIVKSALIEPLAWSIVGVMSWFVYLGMIDEFDDLMHAILPAIAETFGVMMGMWAGANYIYKTPEGISWADASVWIALLAAKFLGLAVFMDWSSSPIDALGELLMSLPDLGLTSGISIIVSGVALMWWNRQGSDDD